jgi:protein gp37
MPNPALTIGMKKPGFISHTYELNWDIVTGCDKVSPACDNCFAKKDAEKLQELGYPGYRNGFNLTVHEDILNKIQERPLPDTTVFACRFSDLFHPEVPSRFIRKALSIMSKLPNDFGFCTKYSARLPYFKFPPNVFLEVTVESADYYERIEHLKQTNARTKALLIGPLLGDMPDLCRYLEGIDYIQIHGELGPEARPLNMAWANHIIHQCREAGVRVIDQINKPCFTGIDHARFAMIYQLFEPDYRGLPIFPFFARYKGGKFFNFLCKMKHVDNFGLRDMVLQVAPEFFES